MKRAAAALVALAVALGAGLWFTGERPRSGELAYVGSDTCSSCHAAERDRWQGSHHDHAMALASPASVLGDFDDARFEKDGVVTTFRRDGARFLVSTDGPTGAVETFEITHAFGWHPLQQYLIPMPGGRLQALGIAWDARRREDGGQRWFALHDEPVPPGDVLHWTRFSSTWNLMCAECHSTGVSKNYHLDGDRYDTHFEEIDVACEACHGPGSRHVGWARSGAEGDDSGLTVTLAGASNFRWDPEAKKPVRIDDFPVEPTTEVCAPCHSRRGVIDEAGSAFLDACAPALLSEGLYFPDGQIRDEVFVWGSFVQSPMHRAGVGCGDCHDPHTLAVHSDSNDLCTRCHDAGTFDTPGHHFHAPESAGARCIACHMPARTYMGVDSRRDHSFRVPRLDLARELGTPEPCSGCHADRSVEWARGIVETRAGVPAPHWATTLMALRAGDPASVPAIEGIVGDGALPAIVRATFLAEAAGALSPAVLRRVVGETAAVDAPHDPIARGLMRYGLLVGLDGAPAELRRAVAGPLLSDPRRLVRSEAARLLADLADPGAGFDAALAEYRATQEADADRAESHANLGSLALRCGDLDRALEHYRVALERNPSFVPAAVNLAELQRLAGDEAACERVLRDTISRAAEQADLHYALALSLTRQQRRAEATAQFARAAALAPDRPRYALAHGLALSAESRPRDAIRVLEAACARFPASAELRDALAAERARAPE